MVNDMRSAFSASNAQAATKKYSQEQTPRRGDYSAQRQLDHRVLLSSGQVLPKGSKESSNENANVEKR